MLIDKLLQQQRLQVTQLAEQGRQRQKLLRSETWLLRQRTRAFISSTPGLMLSNKTSWNGYIKPTVNYKRKLMP